MCTGIAAGLLASSLIVTPAFAQAADSPMTTDSVAASDSVAAELAEATTSSEEAGAGAADAIYRREVFTYPSRNRRDPFGALDADDTTGPRFDDLELSGVIHNDVIGSIAILMDVSANKRYRVRQGQRIGEARVTQIRPSEVEFVVSGFGQARQEILRVKKTDKETEG